MPSPCVRERVAESSIISNYLILSEHFPVVDFQHQIYSFSQFFRNYQKKSAVNKKTFKTKKSDMIKFEIRNYKYSEMIREVKKM